MPAAESAVGRRATGQAAKTRTPLATALAKCDDGIKPVARRLLVDIRFYLDPDTACPTSMGMGSRRKKSSRSRGPRAATSRAVGDRG